LAREKLAQEDVSCERLRSRQKRQLTRLTASGCVEPAPMYIEAKVPRGVLRALRAFYYDTAQASFAEAMMPLTKLVSNSQILFGTNFPFRTAVDHVKGLTECGFRLSGADGDPSGERGPPDAPTRRPELVTIRPRSRHR
jgi:hypothetical protein